MRKFSKPIVIISRCLEFAACRYDGEQEACDFVQKLKKHTKFITVCPEVDMGMPVPRDKIYIIEHKKGSRRLWQPETGIDLTKKIDDFTNNFIFGIKDIDGFILKSRSPSCGIRDTKIFPDKTVNKHIYKSSGMFARSILDEFSHLAVEDEKRLAIDKYRYHFLTKIFMLAEFRKFKKSFKSLEKFHQINHLLFLIYNIKMTGRMEKLVNLEDNISYPEILTEYEKCLHMLLSSLPRNKNKTENFKALFSKIDLKNQTYFQPYPKELK